MYTQILNGNHNLIRVKMTLTNILELSLFKLTDN